MRRHSIDLVSLVFGVMFVIGGGAFLVTDLDLVDLRAGWLAPLGVLLIGVLLFVASIKKA
jgi:hypothetical protein